MYGGTATFTNHLIVFSILLVLSRILLPNCELRGYAVAQLVEALHYKLEVRGVYSRWCHWNFTLT